MSSQAEFSDEQTQDHLDSEKTSRSRSQIGPLQPDKIPYSRGISTPFTPSSSCRYSRPAL